MDDILCCMMGLTEDDTQQAYFDRYDEIRGEKKEVYKPE